MKFCPLYLAEERKSIYNVKGFMSNREYKKTNHAFKKKTKPKKLFYLKIA